MKIVEVKERVGVMNGIMKFISSGEEKNLFSL